MLYPSPPSLLPPSPLPPSPPHACQDTCLSLAQLVTEVVEANMDVLLEQLSDGATQDCEEALEAIQLVLVSGRGY